MQDESKTKAQLIEELRQLRAEAAALTGNQTGERLMLDKRYYQTLFQGVTDYVLLLEAQEAGVVLIVDANDAAFEKHGYTREEMIGQPITFVDKAMPPEKGRELLPRIESGELFCFETEHTCKDGSTFAVEVTSRLVEYEGRRLFFSVEHDITERKQKDEELAKYKLLFDDISDLAYICDDKGNVLFVNQTLELLTGHAPEEIIGKPFAPLFDEKNLAVAMDVFQRTLQGENPEFELTFKDTGILCEYKNSPFRDDAGNITGTMGVARDITERKQRDAQFRSIIDASPVPYALNDEEQNIVYLNPAFINTFGYELQDIPTLKHWWPRAYPDMEYRQWVATTWQEHLDRAKREGVPFEAIELDICCKDGTTRTAIVGASPLEEAFKSMHLVTLFDITERKQRDEQILKLSTAVEQSAASVIITDIQGTIEYVNPSFNSICGYSSEEAIGQNVSILQSGKMPAAVYEELWKTILAGETWKGEMCNKRKDGSLYWDMVSISPIKSPQGEITHFVGVQADITERRQAEKALHEAKEKFQALVESSSDWIWEVDANGVYTYASPKIKDLLGYEPDEMVGKTPFDLMPPGEKVRVGKLFGEIVGTQAPFSGLENHNLHRDGHLVVLETSGVPVFGKDGEFCGYRGVDRDITERKQAEE
ncbi:MAG: PAS domain-containing protein, partial [Mariprofundaceae bacterium]|nr:PAS domain-containing protein [Mariprofundaceae bacterium]